MKPFKCSIYLESVQYLGDSIGDDLVFSFRAFGGWKSIELKLENGATKQFKPAKLIVEKTFVEEKDSIRFPLTIFVKERDPVQDDKGSKRKNHTFSAVIGEKYLFEQTVFVEESRRDKTQKARFVFNFQSSVSEIIPDIPSNPFLPVLSPPVPRSIESLGTAYKDLEKCDRDCLAKCDTGQNIEKCIENGSINLRCIQLYNGADLSCIDNCCR